MGDKGIVASTAGLAPLLLDGIGDTIRVSLTPEPGGDRSGEVRVARQILQSLGLRSFEPQVTACPGCGRTTSTFFQEMAQEIQGFIRDQMPAWRQAYPGSRGARCGGDGVRRERARESRNTPTSGSPSQGPSKSPRRPFMSTVSTLPP